jgi:predicted naringenin-chalcone synthase
MTVAYINRIATAIPENDVHKAFVEFASEMLEGERSRALFRRMAERSGIEHRFSCLQPENRPSSFSVPAGDFYKRGRFPSTGRRMELFESAAPPLARCALDRLRITEEERNRISHVIVTCCTGLNAPGIDFAAIDHLGLSPSVERTIVGFMGCYAAMNALKLARHIVRSEAEAIVLILNLELCTLHLQETQELDQILSFLLFGDGCAACLVSSEPRGFELDSFRTFIIPETRDLITWTIRDMGFDMFLSGKVPNQIGTFLSGMWEQFGRGMPAEAIPLWAAHPGGRTILDAVARGLELPTQSLKASRKVLEGFGNMSSSTIMFVLRELMQVARSGEQGCALAFGPGLTAETLLFHAV